MPSATLGTTNVGLRANTAQFARGMNNAQRQMATFATTAIRVAGIFGVGVFGAGALQGIRSLTQLGASLVETARAADLSVESLQNLRFLFVSDGIGADMADRALLRLNRTLGEAQAGGVRAQETFAALGLSVEELVNLRGEERFIAVANAIRELEDRTLQTDAATRIFGRTGQDLLPVLIQNEEAIRGTVKQSEELGNVSGRNAQALKDLDQVFANFAKNAEQNSANAVGFVIRQFQDLSMELETFEERLQRLGNSTFWERLRDSLGVGANENLPIFERMNATLGETADQIGLLEGSLVGLEPQMGAVTAAADGQARAKDDVASSTDGATSAAERYQQALNGEIDAANTAADANRELADARRAAQNVDVSGVFADRLGSIEGQNRALENRIRLEGLVGAARARVQAEIQFENEVLREQNRLQRQIRDGTMEQAQAARERLDALNEYVRTTGPQIIEQYQRELEAQGRLEQTIERRERIEREAATRRDERIRDQVRAEEDAARRREEINDRLNRSLEDALSGIGESSDSSRRAIVELGLAIVDSLLGPLDQVQQRSSGLGGIIDAIFGGGGGGLDRIINFSTSGLNFPGSGFTPANNNRRQDITINSNFRIQGGSTDQSTFREFERIAQRVTDNALGNLRLPGRSLA